MGLYLNLPRVRLQHAWAVAQGQGVAGSTAPLGRAWFDAAAQEESQGPALSREVNAARRDARLGRKYGGGWEELS